MKAKSKKTAKPETIKMENGTVVLVMPCDIEEFEATMHFVANPKLVKIEMPGGYFLRPKAK